MMTTADLSLRFDPIYEPIARRYLANPEEFADAFARAWFKLTHRDMGPKARYLGPEVPDEDLIWQDPVPAVAHPLIDATDIAALKAKLLAAGLSVSELVITSYSIHYTKLYDADRVMFMDAGQIVEENTPHEFFDNPQNDRTKLFLSQIL